MATKKTVRKVVKKAIPKKKVAPKKKVVKKAIPKKKVASKKKVAKKTTSKRKKYFIFIILNKNNKTFVFRSILLT